MMAMPKIRPLVYRFFKRMEREKKLFRAMK